jgi:hypothetical protein
METVNVSSYASCLDKLLGTVVIRLATYKVVAAIPASLSFSA